jgi:hypothetical protein
MRNWKPIEKTSTGARDRLAESGRGNKCRALGSLKTRDQLHILLSFEQDGMVTTFQNCHFGKQLFYESWTYISIN